MKVTRDEALRDYVNEGTRFIQRYKRVKEPTFRCFFNIAFCQFIIWVTFLIAIRYPDKNIVSICSGIILVTSAWILHSINKMVDLYTLVIQPLPKFTESDIIDETKNNESREERESFS